MLSEALSVREDLLRDDLVDWPQEYESRVFSRELACEELRKLRYANLSGRSFDLQDFHAMLVYFALEFWVQGHNAHVEEYAQPAHVGPFLLGSVDVEHVLEKILWDYDFLAPAGAVNDPSVRRVLRMSTDAWSIANRLEPHPDELVLGERPDVCTWGDSICHYRPGDRYPSDCAAPEDSLECVAECYWDFQ